MLSASPAIAKIDATISARLGTQAAELLNPSATISGGRQAVTRRVQRQSGPLIKRLGYDELGELGRGGLGVVHQARQQAFDRRVAIKRLLNNGDRIAAMQFYAEAVVAARLEHPNIVPVHDLLADERGQLSLVMKCVSGQSWKKALEIGSDSTFNLDDHLDILLKVCEAIDFAHSQGIIHRDLKPENVMLGEHGEVSVMDWGCALAFGEHEHHPIVPRVEEVENIAGTPSYMAPEMVMLEPNRLGPRSDVYLLGAILYELLTGTRPHRGGTVREVLCAAALGEVEPPQKRAPDRSILDELASIAMAALEPDPDKRTPTAKALAEGIRSYRRHAQAVTLAASARQRLTEAAKSRDPAQIDDRLRRACAALENAVEIWNSWPAGQAQLAHACLSWGRHCLTTGGFTQAQALAEQAGVAALKAGDTAARAEAKVLIQRARTEQARSQAHAKRLRLTRWVAVGALALVAVVASVGMGWVRQSQHETETERARAVAALASVQEQEVARQADQRRFAPALLAQGQSAMLGDDLANALTALEGAIAFDPTLSEAVGLRASVLATLGRWSEAVSAAQHWHEVAPAEAAAEDLANICALPPEVAKARLASWLTQEHLPVLVQRLGASPKDLLAIYRARINQAWPGAGDGLEILDDGTVDFPYGKSGLSGRSLVTDLTPIAGIPFNGLDLTGTNVIEVSPLAHAPLKILTITRTRIRDLSSLKACPLTLISANGDKALDLASLSGMHLHTLYASDNENIADLSPLRGMPLDGLCLDISKVHDLAPLAGMPLRHLEVTGSFSDLSPLSQLPLDEVSINSSELIDMNILPSGIHVLSLANGVQCVPNRCDASSQFQLSELYLGDYGIKSEHPFPDLGRVNPSHLKVLRLVHCGSGGIGPLLQLCARAPLEKLEVNWCDMDISMLARAPLLRISFSGTDAPIFWRSLAAFRSSATLQTITINDKDHAVATFWPNYQPEVQKLP